MRESVVDGRLGGSGMNANIACASRAATEPPLLETVREARPARARRQTRTGTHLKAAKVCEAETYRSMMSNATWSGIGSGVQGWVLFVADVVGEPVGDPPLRRIVRRRRQCALPSGDVQSRDVVVGMVGITVVFVRTFAAIVSASALVVAGCGGAETTTAPSPSEQVSSPATSSSPSAQPLPSESVPTAAGGTLVTTAESQFGEILFDDTGQAIYLFDKEKTTSPECYDECAEAWPPVLTEGAPIPAQGVLSDELGSTTRTDGTTQVTYADHPLYYYAHEGKNQVLCHNVSGFGGLWLAVTPSGDPAAQS